jgi:hypothetical protein
MSRYYSIVITSQSGTVITPPGAAGGSQATYTSYVNGAVQPNALDMEMDVSVASFDTPAGQGDTGSIVRIWGISLQEITQAFNLNNNLISVYGGFQSAPDGSYHMLRAPRSEPMVFVWVAGQRAWGRMGGHRLAFTPEYLGLNGWIYVRPATAEDMKTDLQRGMAIQFRRSVMQG